MATFSEFEKIQNFRKTHLFLQPKTQNFECFGKFYYFSRISQQICFILMKKNDIQRGEQPMLAHLRELYWQTSGKKTQLFERKILLSVMRIFLLRIVQVTRVVGGEHRFGTRIAEGTISSGFPVFLVVVPGCSRNNYGTGPNLWVQKKLVKHRQSTQNT